MNNKPDAFQTEASEFAWGFTYHDGMVTNPGKFEGEPAYTPYYWFMSLNGVSDVYYLHNVDRYDLMEVDAFEAEMFSAIDEGDIIAISEDSQGFVYGEINPSF
jgi:hypothetical protein